MGVGATGRTRRAMRSERGAFITASIGLDFRRPAGTADGRVPDSPQYPAAPIISQGTPIRTLPLARGCVVPVAFRPPRAGCVIPSLQPGATPHHPRRRADRGVTTPVCRARSRGEAKPGGLRASRPTDILHRDRPPRRRAHHGRPRIHRIPGPGL